MQITNEKYASYLRGELMDTMERPAFTEKLNAVKHKQLAQARALCILIWMSACRPNEALEVCVKDITKEGGYMKIKMKGSKGGYASPVLLPLKDELVQEIQNLTNGKFAEQYLFWAFRSKSKRAHTAKTYKKRQKDGQITIVKKDYYRNYNQSAAKLHYWFNRWFGVPPYYFRHNRLTLAAQRLDATKLMLLKRAKSLESVRPYIHMNLKVGKEIARELTK